MASVDVTPKHRVYKLVLCLLGAISGFLSTLVFMISGIVAWTGLIGVIFAGTMLIGLSISPRVIANAHMERFFWFSWAGSLLAFWIAPATDLFIPGVIGAFVVALGFKYGITSISNRDIAALALLGGIATLGFHLDFIEISRGGGASPALLTVGELFITWQTVMGAALGWIVDRRLKMSTAPSPGRQTNVEALS